MDCEGPAQTVQKLGWSALPLSAKAHVCHWSIHLLLVSYAENYFIFYIKCSIQSLCQWMVRSLIRLRGCVGWSALSLLVCVHICKRSMHLLLVSYAEKLHKTLCSIQRLCQWTVRALIGLHLYVGRSALSQSACAHICQWPMHLLIVP